MIRFVIPAYNERENIPNLLAELAPRGARTGRARDLRRRRLHRRHRRGDRSRTATPCTSRSSATTVNRGLGTAINSGLRAALGESQDDDAIVTLEADNTSDLSDLPRMLERFHDRRRRGARLGLRTRRSHPRRRALAAWPPPRPSPTCSATPAGCARSTRSPRCTASTAPARLRRAAETYGYLLVREPGFAANVELLLKLYNAGATVAEVPTVNDWSRRLGTSKMSLRPTVARLRAPDGRPPGRPHPAAADLAARQRALGRRAQSSSAPWLTCTRSPRSDERRRWPHEPRAHARHGWARARGRPPHRRRRRRHPRHGALAAPGPGGRESDAAGARAHPRWPGRLDGLLRPPGRPLLPRDRALRRAHDRARRGARLERSAELQAGRCRLLHRRQDAPVQRHRRLPALPAAVPARPRAPGVVRRCSASCAATTKRSSASPWKRG